MPAGVGAKSAASQRESISAQWSYAAQLPIAFALTLLRRLTAGAAALLGNSAELTGSIMPSTTTLCRFQVSHPDYGLIEAVPSRSRAMAVAEYWDYIERSGYAEYAVEVYDLMAGKGKPQLWRRMRKDAERCVESGDFYTERSFWKCIQRRGGKRLEDLSRPLATAQGS